MDMYQFPNTMGFILYVTNSQWSYLTVTFTVNQQIQAQLVVLRFHCRIMVLGILSLSPRTGIAAQPNALSPLMSLQCYVSVNSCISLCFVTHIKADCSGAIIFSNPLFSASYTWDHFAFCKIVVRLSPDIL